VRARLSRKTFGLAFALSALAGGCLLTTDLDGLAGDAALPGEGGSPEAAPGADGGADTGTRDTGADVLVIPDGGVLSPCTSAHAFCSDFDLDHPAAGWSSTEATSPAGTLLFDPFALSPPRALRARHPRKSDGTDWMNALHKVFDVSWRRTIFAGDIYLETPAWQPGDSNFSAVAVLLSSTTQNTGTVFFFSETDAVGTIEHVPDSPARYLPVARIPYVAWTHVVIDFDPAGHLHYEVGAKTFDRDFAAATQGTSPSLDIEVGAISFNGPVPAMDLRWDNVTVDFP
jgi:hypothetical protein